MKKFLFGCGLTLLALTLLVGCASFGSMLTYETTILHPNGTITWAPGLDVAANYEARQAATYQKAQQVKVWKFVGWDYEFEKIALSNAIAKGTHRLGEMVSNMYRTGGYYTSAVYGNSGEVLQEGKIIESKTILIDPTKPGTYYAVEVKTTENQIINVVDEAQYQTYYKAFRTDKIAYISEKLGGSFRDMADNNVFYLHGGKVSGKKIKSAFEKQLMKLPPGTVLINGGLNDDLVIVAEIVDGVIECQVSE
jgi:hypothetical protein